MSTVNAILLAGGKSTRMGRDKARLELGGKTLLARANETLLAAGVDRVLVSGGFTGMASVEDIYPGSGPVGGILSVVDHLSREDELDGSPLLVIPVDMPLLSADMLRALLEAVGDSPSCRYQDEIFPCVLAATPGLRDYLVSAFADATTPGGLRSMKSLLGTLGGISLPVSDIPAESLMNINRPEDMERAAGLLAQGAT